ncbi:MAG TPA: VWA domain-containing protein [Pyrinomonadaceae bacterium]
MVEDKYGPENTNDVLEAGRFRFAEVCPMKRFNASKGYCGLSLGLFLCLFLIFAQPTGGQTNQQPEVIRINTELVQLPVIVLDKQGHFIDGLSREQFELTVAGRAASIAFFERITAGTRQEEEKYQPARRTKKAAVVLPSTPSSYGRTVVFFIDDLHLGTESVNRTRTALLHYIDRSMGQNDRMMIASTSGQIGFLQQLTDNPDVLRAAVGRLNYRQLLVPDDAKPPMSPYQALTIEAGDSRSLNYFADMLVKDQFSKMSVQAPSTTPGQNIAQAEARGENQRRQAEATVKNRAHNLLQQYSTISASTLAVLKNLLNGLDQLAGTKLVFFISDGFFLNSQTSGELQKLNEITSNALRSGSVVYSLQAGGLGTAYTDASKEVRLGPRMDTGAPGIGEDTALQAPLHTVAADTGGRPFFNTNSMDDSVKQALHETSDYYLIAWRPEPKENRSDEFRRVQLAVKNHPEWIVRTQKGFFLPKSAPETQSKSSTLSNSGSELTQTALDKIKQALSAPYPLTTLPVYVSATFLDVPNTGAQVTVGSEVWTLSSPGGSSTEKQDGVVDFVGILLNDQGKVMANFGGQLNIESNSTQSSPEAQTGSRVDLVNVRPGIYQVRVAASDEKRNLTGSDADWIVVPDLTSSRLTLSSLLVGDTRNVASALAGGPEQKARLSINHHFSRSSHLRFLTYVYNASRGSDGKGMPDLNVQMRVRRDDQPILMSPQMKIATDGVDDLGRIPYAAELSLRTLVPGRYTLQVIVTDNDAKSNATQSVKFLVE